MKVRPHNLLANAGLAFLALLCFFSAAARGGAETAAAPLAKAPSETVSLAKSGAPAASAEDPEEMTTADAVARMDQALQKRIGVEYKDVDLSSVLRSLAWAHKLNIVTTPDVKGKVNINLENVTVEQALDAILKVNALTYSRRGGVIYVSTGDPNQVEMATEVIVLKYIKADQAQNIAKKLLSTKGDIRINEISNSLIVTDFPENIVKVTDLMEKVDDPPRQILIEAKIVDMTSTDLAALGVTWNYDYLPAKGGLFDRETRATEELKGSYNMPSQSSTLSRGQLVVESLQLKNANFGGSVDALVRDGKATLLASPSIAVLNGQEARIVIGERYPYKERTQTTSGTTETTKFVDIGTTLRVSPQINDDGYITLYIHPEVSSLRESLDAGPRIATREADTTVRVKEGETLVIGGLIKQEENTTKEHLPFVGKFPLLGFLFGRNNISKEQTELAVFITPKVLMSREEQRLRKRKKDVNEDNYVLLTETGRLNVVERIFKKARALDVGKGLESVRKDTAFRKAQALSQYELIYLEFPESIHAAEAKYRAANIYRDYYKDNKKAMKAYLTVASDFPQSRFAVLSKKAYHELERLKP